ncbi:hypothetical protein [Vibrio sp.]|uniref:hypothetical protein n=1 Tax=Vibrio sp. TaxID=678 RepID=UPI003AA87F26
MWTRNAQHKSADHLGAIIPERVLYEFEEPLIFTATLGLSELLFLKVSEIEGRNLYLATSVYSHVLEALDSGVLSLRGAMESGPCFMVEMANVNDVAKYWECKPDDIPDELLPKRSVGLVPGVEWVADTYEQIDAFFSVRFSGDGLARETMPFQTFKKLVDGVYDAARKMFAPQGLEKAKSSTFDFRIHEPAFGSLIITIDKPLLNPKNVRRHLRNSNLDMQTVQQGFDYKKDEFLREIAIVAGLAEGAELSTADADEHIGILGKVVGLLPGEGTEFSKVEFNGNFAGQRHSVVIEEDAANRLRRAHEIGSGINRSIEGVITITNANSRTFVVRHAGERQITCRIGAEDFEILLQDERFRSQTRVNVTGRFYRRSQRDYMVLDVLPEFL